MNRNPTQPTDDVVDNTYEAQIHVPLHHPNILAVLGLVVAKGVDQTHDPADPPILGIIMELMSSGSLCSYIR